MKKITSIRLFLLFSIFSTAQDTCSTAFPVNGPGIYAVTTINGTAPTAFCAPNGTATLAEWYVYTPSNDFTVTISSNISANSPLVDTRFHVYTGNCTNLICFAGDDDSGSNYSSVDTFNVLAGNSYYIAWDNRWSSNGFSFEVTENPIVIPPPAPVTYTDQIISTLNGNDYNICIVDMNGDHKDDLVSVSTNNLKIHYQATPGNFNIANYAISGTSKMPSWSMAAGDYNRDGYNDLVLGSGSGLSVWTSNASGTAYSNFSPSNYIFCQRTNFADLNNDGNLDVFSCHDIDANVYYLNDGNNNLTYYQCGITPGAMNIGVITGNYATLFTDFDNDGDADVFISKCSGPACELHRNDGNGVYTNISNLAQINITPIQTWSSAIADFDNDGDMDIIIAASAGAHHYFRNNLDTTNSVEEAYTEITSGSGWDSNPSTNIDNVAYDFDNDGFVDVLGGGNKIMFNNGGDGTFFPIAYSTISPGAIGDLNNDGFLDIQNGTTVHYAVPNNNNWLKVSLQGTTSNRNGIGARVQISGSFGTQIRDIRSGEGFRHMSSLNAHFGLGTATAIDEIKIIWPSGTVDVLQNPNINSAIVVTEGATLSTPLVEGEQINIYPNPSAEIITIANSELLHSKTIKIVTPLGQLVKNVKLNNDCFSVEDLAEGVYFLTLETQEGKKYAQQFIKKK